MSTQLKQIPHPTRLPLIGNLLSLNLKTPMKSIENLTKKYYPIMELAYPKGKKVVFITGHELCREVCDEKRFRKKISIAMKSFKQIMGNGLATVNTDNKHWQLANKILLPGFGQKAMKGFHPNMLAAVNQLIKKWDTIPEDQYLSATNEMTKLTFETIALCGFNYSFTPFETDKGHPFTEAMSFSLEYIMSTYLFPEFYKKIKPKRYHKFQDSISYMFQIVDDIILERIKHPEKYLHCNDLINLMLNTGDPDTGEKLSPENIRDQIISFLIAGNETTACLLAFTIYHLIELPEVAKKAYEEVDTVLGTDINKMPDYTDVNKLKYIRQMLFENLRLYPVGSAFSITPHEDTVIGGKYPVKKGQPMLVFLKSLHTESTVWGETPKVFNPENFSSENNRKRDHYSYKPFGNGQRACTGKNFAIQESTLFIAMMLQRYKFSFAEDYKLSVKEAFTVKPDNLMIKISSRKREEKHVNVNHYTDTKKASKEDEQHTCPHIRGNNMENKPFK